MFYLSYNMYVNNYIFKCVLFCLEYVFGVLHSECNTRIIVCYNTSLNNRNWFRLCEKQWSVIYEVRTTTYMKPSFTRLVEYVLQKIIYKADKNRQCFCEPISHRYHNWTVLFPSEIKTYPLLCLYIEFKHVILLKRSDVLLSRVMELTTYISYSSNRF